MKNSTTKKLFAFITAMMLLFSFSLVHAQGNGNGNGNNGNGNDGPCKGNQILCVGKNGSVCKKPADCYGMGKVAFGESLSLSADPNPASGTTIIDFSLEQSQRCSLRVFDVNGRLVSVLADKTFEAGEYEIEWISRNVSSGIYLLQLQSEENLQTLKLIVSK